MAVGRISGPLLKSNLLRDGVDLAFETDLLYLDVSNGRIGIKNAAPGYELDVTGTVNSTVTRTGQALIDNLDIDGNTIAAISGDVNINPAQPTDRVNIGAATIPNIYGDVLVDGQITATGNIIANGNIVLGDADTDSVQFIADVDSNIIPATDDTYTIGSAAQKWLEGHFTDLFVGGISISTGNGGSVALLADEVNKIYVHLGGSDVNGDGENVSTAYRTVKHALSQAVSGDAIVISPGVFEEEFPLTVPAGVSVNGSGIRATTIKPTVATQSEDGFLLNGDTTVQNLSVMDMLYDGGNGTGYAFQYASGATITRRSPYIKEVSVLNRGSVTSASDPFGFAQGDAGRGIKVDGSVLNAASLEAAMLFNAVTLIVPNSVGLELTNGARVEWLNSFVYFADVGIDAYEGINGKFSAGKTYLELSGVTGTIAVNDTATFVSTDAQTTININVDGIDGDTLIFDGRADDFEGFETTPGSITFAPSGASATSIVRYDRKDFGAEMRSIASANVYGDRGVRANGADVRLRLSSHDFGYIGAGGDFSNNDNLVNTANQVIELNEGRVFYSATDQYGDYRIGDLFLVDQDTGAVTFSGGQFDVTSLTGINFTDGNNTTIVDPTKVETGNIRISGNTIESLSGNIIIDPFDEIVDIDATGALKIPVGTTGEQPGTPVQGQIRFNTTDTAFEGYDGAAWSSLGGVKDTDQDTYIEAEETVDDDTLRFYTVATNRLEIDSNGQITAAAGYTPIADQDLVTKTYADTAGTPTDGTWSDGAYLGFTDADRIADVLDELNESLENVRRNTFVRSVTFTGSPTSGGEGTTVTLNLNVVGNANRYDIDWGDGNNTNGTTDSTPSHTYTDNTNSPYTVTVRAYNNGAISGSAGSEASATNVDYIIIYTADPVAAFSLYDVATGGAALTGNNLYVIEGNSLYLENTTSNTLMADVTYEVNWGDGSTNDTVADDTAAGGVSGARLQHTWQAGTNTGTSVDTVTLTLDSHTTANPAVIPDSTTLNLKVYDPNIAAPNGLSTKTINPPAGTGTSPRIAANFTDNAGVAGYVAGDSIPRIDSTVGTVDSSTITTFAYDADNGTLSAEINGSADGIVTFDNTDNSGTYTSLVVTEESDYNLLNASGSSVSFNSSIYHPGLYKGFKARVSALANTLQAGVHEYKLTHSTTGSTNGVVFVKDDLTTVATASGGSLSEATSGTYRYVSGIPHYNTSGQLTLSGATAQNLIGQTYADVTDIIEVTSGADSEGSGSGIIEQNYNYTSIDGTVSMLSGGIPLANTGIPTAYTFGDLTVDINASNARVSEQLRYRVQNVEGWSNIVTLPEIVQIHSAAQSGISEIAIDVSNSLGSTFTDDGLRIFDLNAATTDTPVFSGATNYYTNNVYSEIADPGVAGTQEATIRYGVLEHNVDDYSTGYLPIGPDRSADTGTQYFTFAFRRTVVSNFTINITSSTGVAGVFIAAPGTAIDSASTINGWLDCSAQYAGSGVPGADIGNGGNGSNGCASTGGDIINSGVSLSGGYTMTLGTENLTNATGNVALVRIALTTGQQVTSLSIT